MGDLGMLPNMNVTPLPPESSNNAFQDWDDDEQDIRRFLLTSNVGMSAWFTSQEEEADRQGFDGVDLAKAIGDEGYSAYMEHVGLLQGDYWSALASSAVKSAVSIFEIYWEDSAEELLRKRGWTLQRKSKGESWYWWECSDFYKTFFTWDLKTPEIESARWIRNKLTHLHDTLRTAADKDELERHRTTLRLDKPESELERPLGLNRSHRPFTVGPPKLELTPLDAWRILDALRDVVQQKAPALGEYERMQDSTANLTSLQETELVPGKPKGIIRFP